MRVNLDDGELRRTRIKQDLWIDLVFQTITAAFTIPDAGPVGWAFDATATPRTITLPTESNGKFLIVANSSSAAGAVLTFASAASATILTMAQNSIGFLYCSNGAWIGMSVPEALSGAELAFLDGITAGTVTASKAVVVDTNKDIASFRSMAFTGVMTGLSASFTGTVTASGELDISGTGKIGLTTSAPIGYWGATPAGQPAATSQSACISTPALTALTSGETLVGVISGFNTLVTRCNNLMTLANRLQADLVTIGLIKGSA